MAQLHNELNTLLETLRAERIAVSEDISKERAAVMADVSVLSTKLLDDSSARINAAIDHFFLRAAMLLGILTLLASIVIFVAIKTGLLAPRRA